MTPIGGLLTPAQEVPLVPLFSPEVTAGTLSHQRSNEDLYRSETDLGFPMGGGGGGAIWSRGLFVSDETQQEDARSYRGLGASSPVAGEDD